MQQGNFAGYVNAQNALIPIYDPATTRASGTSLVRDVFPGNIIPQNRISNVAKNLVKVFPALTFPDRLVSNILSSGTVVRNIYQSNGRVDHSINANNKISGSFSQRYRRTDPTKLNGPLPYPFSSQFTGDNQNTIFSAWSTTGSGNPTSCRKFAPGTIETTFLSGLSRTARTGRAKLGIPNLAKVNFPTFTFSEYPQFGVEKDYHKFEDTKQAALNVSWVAGTHSLKFGTEYRDQKMYARLFNDLVGTFAFRPTETGSPTLGGGNSFASLHAGPGGQRPVPSRTVFGDRIQNAVLGEFHPGQLESHPATDGQFGTPLGRERPDDGNARANVVHRPCHAEPRSGQPSGCAGVLRFRSGTTRHE